MPIGEAYELLTIPSPSLQIQKEELPPLLPLKASHHLHDQQIHPNVM